MFIVDFMSNQVEHSDFLCLLLIIYFIIRISFFNYLAKILLGQPLQKLFILNSLCIVMNIHTLLFIYREKYYA